MNIVIRMGRAPRGRQLWSAVEIREDGSERVIVSDVDKRTAKAEAKAYRRERES